MTQTISFKLRVEIGNTSENRFYIGKFFHKPMHAYVEGAMCINLLLRPNHYFNFLKASIIPSVISTSHIHEDFLSIKTPKISVMTFIQRLHYVTPRNFSFNFVLSDSINLYLFFSFFSWFAFYL